jgi:hypothetical protein
MYFDRVNNNAKFKSPYKIIFSNNMIKRLLNRYNQSRERGGFIAGKIQRIEGNTVIRIEEIHPIANISPNPKWTYVLRYSHYNEVLTKLSQNFPQYIPFSYHNHPKTSLS